MSKSQNPAVQSVNLAAMQSVIETLAHERQWCSLMWTITEQWQCVHTMWRLDRS